MIHLRERSWTSLHEITSPPLGIPLQSYDHHPEQSDAKTFPLNDPVDTGLMIRLCVCSHLVWFCLAYFFCFIHVTAAGLSCSLGGVQTVGLVTRNKRCFVDGVCGPRSSHMGIPSGMLRPCFLSVFISIQSAPVSSLSFHCRFLDFSAVFPNRKSIKLSIPLQINDVDTHWANEAMGIS